MRAGSLLVLGFAVLAVAAAAGCIGADTLGSSSGPTEADADPGEAREGEPTYEDSHRDSRRASTDVLVPQPPGTEEELSADYGPFVVGPGQDNNRVRFSVPLDGGFITETSVHLIDPTTGEAPDHMALHLHHAVGFGIEEEPTDPEGQHPFVEWKWATGSERTRGNLTAVADAAPDGLRYGGYMEGGNPLVLDFMLLNQRPSPQTVTVRLEIVFVHGTAEEIAGAADCSGAPEEAGCRAGEAFRDVEGRLWGGAGIDVPREPNGSGTYVWPADDPDGRRWRDAVSREPTGAPWDGTIVAGAGHLHRNGMEVIVANLGPPGSGCEEDVDGDGLPGTTIYRSRTVDTPAEAWPHSGAYQVTATQPSWRAPVHEGDRLTLFGIYANRDQAPQDAMAMAGVYVDTQGSPPPADHSDGCDAAALQPRLEGDVAPRPGYTQTTRHGGDHAVPVCNREGLGASLPHADPCDEPVEEVPDRVRTHTVHIEGFTYTPGDVSARPPANRVPVVEQGEPLVWVNQDAKTGIRHTVTSCEWPCNGGVTANYPQPSGLFDSEIIGNADPASGGADGLEDLPTWRLDTAKLEPGTYAYYDRLHPWMRGWFEVVESGDDVVGTDGG